MNKQTAAEQVEGQSIGDDLIERLMESLGGSARAAAVYGDPIERDGLTIVPVAKIRMGFGFGRGGHRDEGGGGGGVVAKPVWLHRNS